MTDEEVRESARGMVLSWLAEWALMLRSDQSPDAAGCDPDRTVERHLAEILSIRGEMAARWGYPPPPLPFPFPEMEIAA